MPNTSYKDIDGDGYGAGSAVVSCSGADDCVGNPYNSNACISTTGNVSNNTDCNDNSAVYHPGQTYIGGDYGYGYDYDCSGTVEKEPGWSCSGSYGGEPLTTIGSRISNTYVKMGGQTCYSWGDVCTPGTPLTRNCGDGNVSMCYNSGASSSYSYFTDSACKNSMAWSPYAVGGTGTCGCK